MEIVSAVTMAAYTFQRFLDDLAEAAIFGFLPLSFIIFSIIAIVQIVKTKKRGGKWTKAIVFSVLATVFGALTACEAFLLILLAAAVAHM